MLELKHTKSFCPTPATHWDNEIHTGVVRPRSFFYYVGGDYVEGSYVGTGPITAEQTLLTYTIPANTVVNGIRITLVYQLVSLNTAQDFIFKIKGNGTELLTNGDFALDITGNTNGWILDEADWTWNTAQVRKDANGIGTLVQDYTNYPFKLNVGTNYILTYTISNRTAGSVTPSIGGFTGTSRSADGTYYEYFTCTDNTLPLTFTPTNTARFYIDNVSLKQGGSYATNTAANDAIGRQNINFYAVIDDLDWTIDNTVYFTGITTGSSWGMNYTMYGEEMLIEGF